jgi:hypothetical protein
VHSFELRLKSLVKQFIIIISIEREREREREQKLGEGLSHYLREYTDWVERI